MPQIRISVNNQQSLFDIDDDRFVTAIRTVFAAHQITSAEVSVAVVDDRLIHVLNREHLNHDYPTDVLSFLYGAAECFVDGELVVSSETARRVGRDHGMTEHDELLLYIVHGALHLVGLEDDTDESRLEMRAEERRHMRQLGVALPDEPVPSRTEAQS